MPIETKIASTASASPKTFEPLDSWVPHTPSVVEFQEDSVHVAFHPQGPNWIATDARGAQLLRWMDGKKSVREITALYAESFDVSLSKAWVSVQNFLSELKRTQFVSDRPIQDIPFPGRAAELPLDQLSEIWLHTNNKCNLSCSHCLVNSNPQSDQGLPTQKWLKIIEEAHELGVERFYITGGEPFLRPDIFTLINRITEKLNKELIILTNATLFSSGEKLTLLEKCSREKLKLQMSLDGTTASINDPIRGKGVFDRASNGFKNASRLGFDTAMTAVVTPTNIDDLYRLPQLAKDLGAKSMHLMWLHKRGRLLEKDIGGGYAPPVKKLIDLVSHVKTKAESLGLSLDNYETVKARVNGQRNIKYDLGNACWESLCVYCDGNVYPSAATSNHPPLRLGNVLSSSLRDIWMESPVAKVFRQASVMDKEHLRSDPFRFLTGGGDIEHTYFFSSSRNAPSLASRLSGEDPYYEIQTFLVKEAMMEISRAKMRSFVQNSHAGWPHLFHAMGEGALVCGSKGMEVSLNRGVSTLHSNCVLSFDVDKPRRIVRHFYGQAAENVNENLCCPTPYEKADTAHIPQEVLDRFYGCGSPLKLAELKKGDKMVDLGSGAGIDCFIAAKTVGRSGQVIGVDMTDQMLEVALRNNPKVAKNLGYNVVEFKKGFLEKLPIEENWADVITSNCVINLSPDKKAVFREMWRALKPHGRAILSDIVTSEDVPPNLRVNEQLWGECLSGALSESEFLSYLEQAGFYGLTTLKTLFWKNIEGHDFFSITLLAYKQPLSTTSPEKKTTVHYKGPLKAVMDEQGRTYPRMIPMDVSLEVAEKLSKPPYAGMFRLKNGSLSSTQRPEDKKGRCC